jgi:sulfate permease, SulP family
VPRASLQGRLSSTTAGVTMFAIILGLSEAVGFLPIATLVGIIFQVAVKTFAWEMTFKLFHVPRIDAAIIVVSVPARSTMSGFD